MVIGTLQRLEACWEISGAKSLEAVIAVGFRTNVESAIVFCQWATSVLKDFSIRGYIMDKERLKNGTFLNEDYFDHLLEEIREIRTSERRFYQIVTMYLDYAENQDKRKIPMTMEDWANKLNVFCNLMNINF